ncbi:MAG TPA: hypothetical protein VF721_06515 [Pyrinomonadaceae bacterium]|jgi:hypothetical protein
MSVRLDKFSFEQFVEFVFNPQTDHILFISGEYSYGNPSVTLRHLTRLFRRPEFLLDSYNPNQLEKGFFYVVPYLLCEVKFYGLLWDKRVPLSLREECISSMFDLFARFFAVNPLEHSCFMWWDGLAYGYYMENGAAADEDGIEIRQAMFETLKRILEIDSEDCQKSALHGLGHLRHPETEKTINDFLRRHKVNQKLKDYAYACIAGTMDRSQ